MPIAISKLSKKKPFKALIYSEQGDGKTTFAASCKGLPDFDEVLLVNIDKGDLSISDLDIDQARIGIDPETGLSTKTIVKDLEDLVFQILGKKNGLGKYKTLIIDTLTELQTQDLEDIAGAKDQISQPDYGKDTKKLRKICSLIRDVPLNIILTAQVRKVYEGQENPKLVEIRPSMTESAAKAFMEAVDYVWFLYVDPTGKRQLVTKKTGVVKAKSRGKKFQEIIGEKVENPNLPELYAKLQKVME